MSGGQWLAKKPHRKETSSLSSIGSEGADQKATRDRSAVRPSEDVNGGVFLARGESSVDYDL